MLFTPDGRSHSTCNATVGQTPVSRCTMAASLSFSSVDVAAAGCRNLPNRVPVLANPHEGSSIWNESSARETASSSFFGMATGDDSTGGYNESMPQCSHTSQIQHVKPHTRGCEECLK